MDWQRTPSINKFEWPTEFVWEKAAENRHASEPRRRALVIRGKDIREYTTVLQDAIRMGGGYVLNGPEDAASFILGGAGEFQNRELKRLFDPVKKDSVERFGENVDKL